MLLESGTSTAGSRDDNIQVTACGPPLTHSQYVVYAPLRWFKWSHMHGLAVSDWQRESV
jgi:hypothetical protein